MNELTALYRYFDADGRLLYVGIASHFPSRVEQHARYDWWEPKSASMTIEHFPDRETAHAAELVAIRDERPRYNRAGSPRHQRLTDYLRERRDRRAPVWVEPVPEVPPAPGGWGAPPPNPRLDELTAPQRQLVMALIDAAKDPDAAEPVPELMQVPGRWGPQRVLRLDQLEPVTRDIVVSIITARKHAAEREAAGRS